MVAACTRAEPTAPSPGSDDVWLPEACVAGGPETCFNARDDNCNGLIDEGCGTRTGIVEFTIAWDARTADVDLLVTDPGGELVEPGPGRISGAGLVKERDCPGPHGECRGRNVENVYLEKDEAKKGVYRVKIALQRLEDEDLPVRVTFGARVGQRSYAKTVVLDTPRAQKRFDFVL